MFRSIRWRIAVAFAALLVVCIGGPSIYLSHSFRYSYVKSLMAQLTDQAKLVSDRSSGLRQRDQISHRQNSAFSLI